MRALSGASLKLGGTDWGLPCTTVVGQSRGQALPPGHNHHEPTKFNKGFLIVSPTMRYTGIPAKWQLFDPENGDSPIQRYPILRQTMTNPHSVLMEIYHYISLYIYHIISIISILIQCSNQFKPPLNIIKPPRLHGQLPQLGPSMPRKSLPRTTTHLGYVG